MKEAFFHSYFVLHKAILLHYKVHYKDSDLECNRQLLLLFGHTAISVLVFKKAFFHLVEDIKLSIEDASLHKKI